MVMLPGEQAIPLRSVSLHQQRDGLTLENGVLNSGVKQTNKNTEGEVYYCFLKIKRVREKSVELLSNDFINEIYRETFNGTKIVRLFKN